MQALVLIDRGNLIKMSDESDNERSRTPKKKLARRGELLASEKDKHRAQKYRPDWEKLDLFKDWLRRGRNEYKAKCIVCDIELVSEYTVLKIHASRQKHIKALSAAPSTSKQRSIMSFVTKEVPKNKIVAATEIKLAGFIAEHNIAFQTADHMSDLINEILDSFGVENKISMKRTKATAVVTEVIGESEKSSLADKLTKGKFSVLSDESTDISTHKASCIIVRYFDPDQNKIVSKFWELCKIFNSEDPQMAEEGATGENLYKILMKSFSDRNISTENIIGFGADGCNVMMGAINSVASRLKKNLPGIYIIKCVCHSAHLCASEACKQLPRRCEDLAREIYGFFKNSSKRLSRLQQFQQFVNVSPHKILHPSQTRWLSLVAVVDRLLEQWSALTLFFTDCWLNERLVSTELIHNSLNDPFMQLFYMFLSWILPKFTNFNKFFQSEKVVITTLNEKVREMYKDILLCFLDRDYVTRTELSAISVDRQEKWLRDDQMYLGIQVMNMVTKPEILRQVPARKDFFHRCRQFLITSAREIKKRYDLDDALLSKIDCIEPVNAISSNFRNKMPSLQPVMTLVPRIVNTDNIQEMQAIDDEWRSFPNLIKKVDLTLSPDEFWGEIKQRFEQYKTLAQFALNLLCLPHSSADCERAFSEVNLIKTKIRNNLTNETVNGTLLAKQLIRTTGNCTDFKPTDNMIKMMSTANLYKKKVIFFL